MGRLRSSPATARSVREGERRGAARQLVSRGGRGKPQVLLDVLVVITAIVPNVPSNTPFVPSSGTLHTVVLQALTL